MAKPKSMPKWRVARAFQNNGPDYFIVSRGFGYPAICQPAEEAYGELIADALNKAESA